MNTITTTLSLYLEQMVEENYLLTKEAQAANRLPEDLQEKAVELSEAQRVLAMEKIVSDLLNPKTMQQPASEPTLPPASAVAQGGLETFLSSIKTSFFERAYYHVGDIAFNVWDGFEAIWKNWSFKKKLAAGAAMLFVLSGFGVFHAMGVPFVWLYHHWHTPFVTLSQEASKTQEHADNSNEIAQPIVSNVPVPEPLPIDAMSAHEETKTAAVVRPPRNLRWDRSGPHAVHLMWDLPAGRQDSPGAGYRYNVYVAHAGDHPVFDTGNDTPLDGPEITWTAPIEGLQVFELYLKAVDAKGRESAASNQIIADLR